MVERILNRAQLADGSVVDVAIADGHIADITPAALRAQAADGRAVVDNLDGWMLLPAPVEPHAHLDKAYLAEAEPNHTGDLMGAIQAMERLAPRRSVAETIERAERATRTMAANGYVAVRTHVDVTDGDGLRNVEALIEVRERVADLIDVEIVGLVGIGHSEPSTGKLARLRDAIDMGADLVGGCPHLEPISARSTDALLALATDRGVGVDLHTDENTDPASSGLDELVTAVESGFDLPTTASHCSSLGQRPVPQQRALAERVAATGVAIVALPVTNLFLQGRDQAPSPRAIAPVGVLLDAGAHVSIGADNLQDPFNPIGRACPFETAALAMVAAHLLPDEAWAATSRGPTPRARRAVTVGAPANLLAVRARSLRAAIAEAPERRRYLRGHPDAPAVNTAFTEEVDPAEPR